MCFTTIRNQPLANLTLHKSMVCLSQVMNEQIILICCFSMRFYVLKSLCVRLWCIFESTKGVSDKGFYLFKVQLLKTFFNNQLSFDFRKLNQLGQLKFSSIDSKSSTKKVFVATEENVIAALSVKTGRGLNELNVFS